MPFQFGSRFSGGVYGKSYDTTKGKMRKVTEQSAEAVTDRYLPNNETLDSSSVLDELIPQSYGNQLKMFRTIAKTDAVGGPAIDLISSFAWCDGSVTGIDDKGILARYDEAFHMMDPQTVMPQMTHSFLTDGCLVDSLIFDPDRGTFTDHIPQDPMFLSFTPIPIKGFDPKVDYKGNSDIKKFINSNDPRDQVAKSRIPSGLLQKLVSGGNVPLEPLNTLYVPRLVSAFDWIGTSLLWRIIPFYAVEKALWNATISSARRRARSITHVKCGIQDYWEPTGEDLDNIVNLFMASEEDPVGAYVVTRDGVETEEVRPAGDFWKISDEWDMLTAGKTRSLGLSEALLSADTVIGTSDQGMALFYDSERVLRAELTNRIYYRKMFANIARANGYVKKKDTESTASVLDRMDETYRRLTEPDMDKSFKVTGSVNGSGVYAAKSGLTMDEAYDIAYKDLLIPEISWKKALSPIKDDSYFQILQTLTEQGVPILKKQWAAAGGFDLDKQIEGMDEDLRLTNIIQEKLAKGKGGTVDEDLENKPEDEGDWEGTSSASPTGVTAVFDNFVFPGKKTFFGIGPEGLRKVLKNLFKDDIKVLDDSREVRRRLSEYYDGNTTKVNAACYLMNRALVTDVVISMDFLEKLADRLNIRMAAAKGDVLKSLMKERAWVYAEYAKHQKNKKEIKMPKLRECPDKLKGDIIYSGIPSA